MIHQILTPPFVYEDYYIDFTILDSPRVQKCQRPSEFHRQPGTIALQKIGKGVWRTTSMTSRRGRRTEPQRGGSPSRPSSVKRKGTAGAKVSSPMRLDAPQATVMQKLGQQSASKFTQADGGRRPPCGDNMYHEQGDVRTQDEYPDIPTEDFNQFIGTLVDGIRSDGAELVASTREAVASTFHVGFRFARVWM